MFRQPLTNTLFESATAYFPHTSILQANSRFWVHFRGINYSAEVFLNGTRVKLEQPRGMFLRRALDVTSTAEKQKGNKLAVLVHPPDHPGCVDLPGQGADHQVICSLQARHSFGRLAGGVSLRTRQDCLLKQQV
jgi:hypothetical protein